MTLFSDPTPNAIIMARYLAALSKIAKENTDFSDGEFDRFVQELIPIAWKMAATWKHLNAYVLIEDALIEAEKPKPPIETLDYQYLSYSQELYFELDGFLVQMKSTLDYLAKMPQAVIGKDWPYLATFGDKGNLILKALRNNVPKKWKNSFELIEWLIDEHQPWLEMAIDARDMINHYLNGGLSIESSVVAKTTVDGVERILVPMWVDNLTLREYLNMVWANLFSLVEQFTMRFLSFRMTPDWGFINIPRPIESTLSPFQVLPEKAVLPAFELLNHMRNQGTKTAKDTNNKER